MKYIVFIISMIAGITMSAQQLKQIQKGTDRNQIPVTNGYQNTQVYRNAIPYILDTLGIRDSICCLDSIYFSSGRVYLRDGSGSALIPVPSVTGTISGHQIGVFNPGGGVNVPIRETVTTFSSIASGVRTYTSEDGTQYDLDAESTNELQELTLLDSTNRVFLLEISNGNFVKWKDEVGGGATQYLNPYIIGGDTVGFYLTVAQDTVLFLNTIDTASYCCPPSIGNDTLYIGDYYVVLPSGEATTVGDTPTINMTLTGVNITGEVIDGSITPAKLDRTYLETEVDGSTTNEIELPSQTGNSGKYLSTNGTNPSWETLSGGGYTDYALLDHGSSSGNTQTLTLGTWNTITFSGAQESDSGVINADASTEEIDFVVAGTYRIEYFATWIANVSTYVLAGIYSDNGSAQLTKSQVQVRSQTGFLSTTVSKVFYHTAIAGETIKLQINPDSANHTSVGIYSYLIATKVN